MPWALRPFLALIERPTGRNDTPINVFDGAAVSGEGFNAMSGVMDRVGVGLWTLQSSAANPANPTALYQRFAEDALIAEQQGFHSVWASEHRFWYDGFCPALLHAEAFVAARTSRIRVGQCMLLAPQHDPAALARNAQTLQRLSAGRLELGLGLGYRDTEFDGLGLRRDRRGALMEAALDALEAVGARIWLGGMAPRALARAASRGHGLLLPQTLFESELIRCRDSYRELGGTGRVGILRDVWIESDPRRVKAARGRVVGHYVEEAGSWWSLKGQVGFSNPAALAQQERRLGSTAIIGAPDEVAERLRADLAAGVEMHVLRLCYDVESQAQVHEQIERIAREVAPLLAAA